ncbi:hypothetical protein T4B_5339, partial [Trichinella pseudospiralis]
MQLYDSVIDNKLHSAFRAFDKINFHESSVSVEFCLRYFLMFFVLSHECNMCAVCKNLFCNILKMFFSKVVLQASVHQNEIMHLFIGQDVLENSYRTLNGFTKDSSPPEKLFTGNDDWFNNYWLQNSTLIKIIIISPRKRPRLRKGKFPSRSATSYSAMEFCNAVLSWISSAGLRIRCPCL